MEDKAKQNLLMVDVIKIILSTDNKGKFTVNNSEFVELYNKYMDIKDEYDIWNERDKLTNRNGDIDNTDSQLLNSIQILSGNTDNEIRKGFNNKKRTEREKFKELGILFFKLLRENKEFIKFEDEETRDKIVLLLKQIKELDENIEILNSISSGIIEGKAFKNNINVIRNIKPVVISKTNIKDDNILIIKENSSLKERIINIEKRYKARTLNNKNNKKHSIIKHTDTHNINKYIVKDDNKHTKPLTEKHIIYADNNINNNKHIKILKNTPIIKYDNTDNNDDVIISSIISKVNKHDNNIICNKDTQKFNTELKTVLNTSLSEKINNNKISSSIVLTNTSNNSIEIQQIKKEMELEIMIPFNNKTKSPDSVIINDNEGVFIEKYQELNKINNNNNKNFLIEIPKHDKINNVIDIPENNKKNVVFVNIPEHNTANNDNVLIGGNKIIQIKKSKRNIIKTVNELYNTSSASSEMDEGKINKIDILEEKLLQYPDKKSKEYKNIYNQIYNIKKSKKRSKYKKQYLLTGGKKQAILEELNKII